MQNYVVYHDDVAVHVQILRILRKDGPRDQKSVGFGERLALAFVPSLPRRQ